MKIKNVSIFFIFQVSPSSPSSYSSDMNYNDSDSRTEDISKKQNSDENHSEDESNEKTYIQQTSIQIELTESTKENKCIQCKASYPCNISVYQNRMIESVSENLLQNKLICCNFCCETF